MNSALATRITRTYDQHPLNAAAILERIRERQQESDQINEIDLAKDEETFVTDQNHTGGLEAVVALAEALKITGNERVLDIGTGLGGTPRALAHLYGCRCHGIELTRLRYQDAVELTRLVGLEKLVTFSLGDFLTMDVPHGPFDVLIGQATLMHFPDLQSVLKKSWSSRILDRGFDIDHE